MGKHVKTSFGILLLISFLVGEVVLSTETVTTASEQPQPLNFTVSRQRSHSLTLTWEPPEVWTGEGVGYVITTVDENGKPDVSTKLNGVLNCRFVPNRLRPSTNYTFSLVAVANFENVQVESDPVRLTAATAEFDEPTPPRNFRIVSQSSSKVNLAWDQPRTWTTADGGYIVSYSQISVKLEEKDITTYEGNDFELGNWYTVNLTAYSAMGGQEKYSEVVQLEVQGKPAMPLNLQVSHISSSMVNLTWDKPIDETVDGYVVFYHAQNTNTSFTTDKGFHVGDLEPWTDCSFTLASYKLVNNNTKVFSENVTLDVRTNFTEPSIPRNLTLHEVSAKQLLVTWLEPKEHNGPLSGYVIRLTIVNTTREYNTTATRYEIENIEPWKNYNITVVAFNKDEFVGPLYSEEAVEHAINVAAPGVMDPPTKVGHESTSLHVTWTQPKIRNGPINGYVLMLMDTEGKVIKNATTSDLEMTFTDLQPWTEYVLSIYAWNEIPELLFEGPAVNVTLRTSVAAPSIPKDAQISNVTNSSFVISWEEPDVLNGPLTGYTLKCKGGSYTGFVQQMDANFTFEDLDPWTEYNVTLSAFNREPDWQEESPEVFLSCKTGPSAPPLPTKNLQVASTNTESASLNIPRDLFSDEKGDIVEYILLVTSNSTEKDLPGTGYDELNQTSFPTWDEYNTAGNWFRASPINWNYLNDTKICNEGDEKTRKCTAGKAKNCNGEKYCSGPLKANKDHWAKIRTYTSNGWSETIPVSFKTVSGSPVKTVSGLLLLVSIFAKIFM